MSIMNPLPPQAYTKETLVQAYAWLQSQNENIKEIASTPDVLVSLYLKAKMQGDGALERPSIQNFKNELKNLAGMMGEFEVVDSAASSTQSSSSKLSHQTATTIRFRSQDFRNDGRYEKNVEKSVEKERERFEEPVQQELRPSDRSSEKASQRTTEAPHTQQNSSSSSASPRQQSTDSRSLDMIQEVKNQFNLSSDTEAMRLLIAVGYNQVKGLLK
jgi:hypothetical protein